MSGKADHQERVSVPSEPAATGHDRDQLGMQIEDMGLELVRMGSVLDYLEKHGDDDCFSVVSMMRPFADALTAQLDDLRVAVHH